MMCIPLNNCTNYKRTSGNKELIIVASYKKIKENDIYNYSMIH